ncbi:MAG: transcriptional regulator [Candidatus Bathyarchaeota archaeon]|nr:MAG: transcriptional regulator [Candidatus Bathyarchaeota archaeon]
MVKRQKDDVVALLEIINESLKSIDNRLADLSGKCDAVLANLPSGKPLQVGAADLEDSPLDVVTLLSLPDHLRKTAMILCKEEEATAEQIAEKTGRARAVESGYLNQLHTMGHINKKRKGRDVYFYIER